MTWRGRAVDWNEVQDEIDDALGHRHDRGHPVLTAGTALLLLGSAAYLLGLSPGAEDRRRRCGATARRWIGDVGELARKAGRAVGSRAGNSNTRGQHDPIEPVARPTAHPVELHGRITDAIAAVSTEKSDVTVLIREGVVVIQGTAAPEEYDAIVRAIDSVTHTYVNEIQAASLT